MGIPFDKAIRYFLLTDILVGIGFKQRELIEEILPDIAKEIKQREVAKIDAFMHAKG